MPKRKGGPNSELMVRAAAEGGRLAQATHEERAAASARSNEQLVDVGKQLVAMGERSKDREAASEEAQKERNFRSTEATKDRAQRAKLQAEEISSREHIAAGQQDVEAAHYGLEKTGAAQPVETRAQPGEQYEGQVTEYPQGVEEEAGGEGGTAQAQISPEEQRKQQNYAKHTTKGLENVSDGKNRHVPSAYEPSALSKALAQAKINDSQARVLREQRLTNSTISRYEQAQLKQNETELKEIKASLTNQLKSQRRLIDDVRNLKLSKNDARWSDIEDLVMNDPEMGGHPAKELVQEVQNRIPGPNISRFLAAREQFNGLKFAARTGDLPDDEVYDDNHALWRQFNGLMPQVQQDMVDANVNDFVHVTSTLQRQRMVRKATAKRMIAEQMLKGQAAMEGGAAGVGTSGQPAGPSAPGPTGPRPTGPVQPGAGAGTIGRPR